MQKQLDETMRNYETLKQQNSGFDSVLATKDSIINANATEIQSLINQLKASKSSQGSSVASVDKQQKEIREKENTIRKLRAQIDEQEKQIKQLSSGSTSGEATRNSAQVANLQKQLSEQQTTINQLQKEVDGLRSAQSSATSDKSACENRVADLNAQVKSYQSQLAQCNKQVQVLSKDIEDLRKESAGTSQSSNAALTSLQNEVKGLKAQLAETKSLCDKYKSDAAEASKQTTSLQNDLAKCQSDLAAKEAQVKSLSSSQSEGGKTEQQLRSELAQLAKAEAACRATNENLNNQLQQTIQQCDNDRRSLQASIEQLNTQIASLQNRVSELTAENKNLVASQNNASQNNASQNSASQGADMTATVNALNAQVETQRQHIAQLENDLRIRDAELAACRNPKSSNTTGSVNKRIAELQQLCDSYAAEIERLRAENDQLRAENNDLKEKMASSASLFAENERLQQKVKLASVLVTTDLKVTPGKDLKPGNVLKTTTKASQTKFARIECRIIDNNVVDPGTITIYARISNAANQLVAVSADGDSFLMDGMQMQYTLKQDIEFTGFGRKVSMMWRKADSITLLPGLYWVTLYANGYEIGKTSFKLD